MTDPDTAHGIRRLARQARQELPPGHIAGEHFDDAARVLDLGLHDGAVRHLRAAAGSLQPRQLQRAGITDDETHAKAARLASEAIRHAMRVREENPAQEPAVWQYAATGTRRTVELARTAMGL